MSHTTQTYARQIVETLYDARKVRELYLEAVNTTLEMARHCSFQDLYLQVSSSHISIDADLRSAIIDAQVHWLAQNFSTEDLYAISLMVQHSGCKRFVESLGDFDRMQDHGIALIHEKNIGKILDAAEKLQATIVLPSKKESESN